MTCKLRLVGFIYFIEGHDKRENKKASTRIEAKKYMRVCQNSFSAKDSYHFVKKNRYQRVNNSMITVTLIFMRE